MLKRLKYLVAVFSIAVLLFEVNRLVFLIYNNDLAADCSFGELCLAMLYGLKLDIITAGYITILPLIATIVTIWLRVAERGERIWQRIMVGYYAVIVTLVAFIETADIGMFGEWQSRIDAQVMIYSPKEMLASVSLSNGIAALLYIGATLFAGLWLYRWVTRRWFDPHFEPTNRLFPSLNSLRVRMLSTLIMILVGGGLFIVVRGGLSTATANISKVYFSPKMFLNQAAINPVFSFLSTLFQGDNFDEYNFYEDSEAIAIFTEAMRGEGEEGAPSEKWLTHDHPNVVLIILEGMGRSISDTSEGGEAVAPNLHRLREEGIWFEHTYASSFRTDRGTVAILSGFPAQPKMSIMKYINKAAKLPGIARTLRDEEYNTRFIYGGDANFTNTRAYLFGTGFNEVVDEREVNFGGHRSKWGSADDAVLNWASNAIIKRMDSGARTFDVILTLSSHEPFEVPYRRLGDDKLNAYAFTDSEVGSFVERMRNSEHWDNTLIVIIADHGYPFPSATTYSSPERHHIPMLWVGGAVSEPRVINDPISQTDLAATLLAQMGVEHSDFIFSRDVSSPATSRFGYWTFNNGFGIIDNRGVSIYDHTGGMVLQNDDNDTLRLHYGKAMLQRTFMEIKRL
jgi:phosphoglycerol transferase MdoB-like AlkP superfamily enzyme